MKIISRFWYTIVYALVRFVMFFWHPVFHVSGRERIPEGRCVLGCNHVGLSDAVWVILGCKQKRMMRIMVKEELMRIPVLNLALRWLGVISVKRGGNDVTAIKSALKALKAEEKLLIFPEGTRSKNGEKLEGKSGAVLLASRTQSPVLPVYLQVKRHPFGPMRLVIGEAYQPVYVGEKPTPDELHNLSARLMDQVYALEETT